MPDCFESIVELNSPWESVSGTGPGCNGLPIRNVGSDPVGADNLLTFIRCPRAQTVPSRSRDSNDLASQTSIKASESLFSASDGIAYGRRA